MSKGRLYICPTPIGNLEDITLRALRILKEVDIIAAEDTRRTLQLLRHFDIETPLISYHQHNERAQSQNIIQRLLEGQELALVSDAGMPGISDPGEILIKRAIEEGIVVEPLPGATAGILALVGSGLDTTSFAFEGFLDRKRARRRERLEKIKTEDRTLIFYEAPHRIRESLRDMLTILGNRRAVVARELTKKYEEFIRGSLDDLVQHFQDKPPRGELVILCQGMEAEELEARKREALGEISIRQHVILTMEEGNSKKEAIKKVAQIRGLPKSQVYKKTIDIDI